MNEFADVNTRVWCAFVQSLYDRKLLTNNDKAIAKWFAGWDADAIIAPSHSYLANACNICTRTVRTILAKLKALGVIDWHNQWTDPADDANGKPHQTSNRYARTLPEGLIEAGITTPAYDGKRCRQKYITRFSFFKARRAPRTERPSDTDVTAAKQALAAISARRAAKRDAEWLQERQAADAKETLQRSRHDTNSVQSAAAQPRRVWS